MKRGLFFTDDNHINYEHADVIYDDAELQEITASAGEGVAGQSGVGTGLCGAAEAEDHLNRFLRQESGENDNYDPGNDAELLEGRRESHDSGADDGGGEVEDRAGEGGAVEFPSTVVVPGDERDRPLAAAVFAVQKWHPVDMAKSKKSEI